MTEGARAAGDLADAPVRRRVMRLLHVPPLALLLGLGLAPVFLLFPRLPGGPEPDPAYDPTLHPVALWLGAALLGGLAGALDGAARPLYRAGALLLAAALLSIPAMRLALRSGLPFPHGLATWFGLDGEAAMDAGLYEIWLIAWTACLGLLLLARHGLARVRRGRAARPGARSGARSGALSGTPSAARTAGPATTATTGPRSRPRGPAR